VIPAAGNSTTTRDYEYTDRNIDRHNKELFFYRLKQVDQDNSFRYSSIVRLNYRSNGARPTIVYPNPTNGYVNILVGDPALVGTEAVVSDISGRILQRVKITANNQLISLNNYNNGIYFIRLSNNESLKVVKQ
jgi:hypothetical protein